MKALMIAAPSSSSGKTMLTVGLIRALRNQGYRVSAFKAGPDYIDPSFHRAASGGESYNLDSCLCSEDIVRHLFYRHAADSDIAVIEGVMGLYDGVDTTVRGSSADLAGILDLPVLLVLNGHGASVSLSALVKGMKEYRKDLNLIGVILNRVSQGDYYQSISRLIEADNGIPCFGNVPPVSGIEIKSRHLGLVQPFQVNGLESVIEKLAWIITQNIDLTGLWRALPDRDIKAGVKPEYRLNDRKLSIAIARDEAFSFYYPDNLELFESNRVTIRFFSPIHDRQIPEGVDGIYLGGGYPELYADILESNQDMRSDVYRKLNQGLPCYAECGGLMYLTRGLKGSDGSFHEMSGFFNCKTMITGSLKRFGYTDVNWGGCRFKAHEFHYSELFDMEEKDFDFAYQVTKKHKEWYCGLRKKNVLAGYPHVHFYSNPDFFRKILELFKKGGVNDHQSKRD